MKASPEDVARLKALQLKAYEHLMQGRADLARPLVDEFRRHVAPTNKALDQLVVFLESVAFEWPAERAPYEPAARPAPTGGLDIVAFHVDRGGHALSGIHDHGIDYMDVLAQSFESARLRAPRARTTLLTDEATSVPPATRVDEVVREPIDRDRLMYERMRMQARFLERRDPGRATVFTDTDVMMNRDPMPVFAEDFDVGLTWRPGAPDAPFNGGMIFVAPGEGGARFFAEALRCYDALADEGARKRVYPKDLRGWWGDQYALAAMVGYRQFAERSTQGIVVNGMRVRFFPCETHNFTVEAQNYPVAALRDKYFLHFKGNRKALQSQYLEAMRSGRL